MSKVSIIKCHSYDITEVVKSIRSAIDLIGGINYFVKQNNKVLLKPNLLSAKRPEEAITTHPAVLEAVIELVKEAGGVPTVGDSPGGKVEELKTYWEMTGTTEVCRRHNVELVSFEKSGSHHKLIHGRSYHLARPVLDADVVINLPKLKTHYLTVMTCAIKNIYGVVPGLRKSIYHREAPKPWEFSELLVDIFSIVKPQLTIVDAVVGMDGTGPSAGRVRELGFIMAGADGVAVDAVASHLLGLSPLRVPTTRIAFHRGLGQADLKKIEVIGDAIDPLKDFQWPPTWIYYFIPSWLARLAAKLFWLKPMIDPGRCSRCGACVESCPTSALSATSDVPVFNYKLCIHCQCCQEICPQHAVYQKKSAIAGLVR
jgi:uncharacterized protein (DUF362 family)/Pyruvate/2-oxoacid:ferredoxin oxidoreductase delta subunit